MIQLTDKPTLQDFYLEGVKHIVPEEAYHAVKSDLAILLDIREKYE